MLYFSGCAAQKFCSICGGGLINNGFVEMIEKKMAGHLTLANPLQLCLKPVA